MSWPVVTILACVRTLRWTGRDAAAGTLARTGREHPGRPPGPAVAASPLRDRAGFRLRPVQVRRPQVGRFRSGGPAGSGPAAPASGIVRPAAPPYGLIAIYTLLEDRVADFDRIADQTAEEVRTHEPDTLVYVIHTVPKAPMQRIFYEIYRDRAAYDRHEQQAYIKRFATARRPCVLATNVIELRLKYAKISPLGQAGTQAGTQPAGAVGTAEASGAGPAAATFPAGAPAQAGPRPLGRSSAAADPDDDAYPAGGRIRPPRPAVAARSFRQHSAGTGGSEP